MTPTLQDTILLEDEAIVVINKPAGWVVNSSKTYDGPTVQDWFARYTGSTIEPAVGSGRLTTVSSPYGTPEEIFRERGGIVHRLDKDTSGVLILAKTSEALTNLLAQFKTRTVRKTYIALVHGKLVPGQGVIRLPIDRSRTDRKTFTVSVAGRLSETMYTLLEFFPGLPQGISVKKGKRYQGFSLTQLEPKTGRTHQIRVHMRSIGHPVVGDQAYVGGKRAKVDREWCPRQFLHAKSLQIIHPMTKEEITLTSELTPDLREVLHKLQT